MRETRPSGSAGGGTGINRSFLPRFDLRAFNVHEEVSALWAFHLFTITLSGALRHPATKSCGPFGPKRLKIETFSM